MIGVCLALTMMAQGRQLDAATADSIKICTLLKNASQQPVNRTMNAARTIHRSIDR